MQAFNLSTAKRALYLHVCFTSCIVWCMWVTGRVYWQESSVLSPATADTSAAVIVVMESTSVLMYVLVYSHYFMEISKCNAQSSTKWLLHALHTLIVTNSNYFMLSSTPHSSTGNTSIPCTATSSTGPKTRHAIEEKQKRSAFNNPNLRKV